MFNLFKLGGIWVLWWLLRIGGVWTGSGRLGLVGTGDSWGSVSQTGFGRFVLWIKWFLFRKDFRLVDIVKRREEMRRYQKKIWGGDIDCCRCSLFCAGFAYPTAVTNITSWLSDLVRTNFRDFYVTNVDPRCLNDVYTISAEIYEILAPLDVRSLACFSMMVNYLIGVEGLMKWELFIF